MATVWWQQSGWWPVIVTAAVALLLLTLVIYTARLWRSTSRMVENSSEATKEANRAYLGWRLFFFGGGDDEAPIQKISIRNFGQTPAHRVWVWCERAAMFQPRNSHRNSESPWARSNPSTRAGSHANTRAHIAVGISKRGFFTYGRIVYKDIYGRWWTTCFCYHHDAEIGFAPYGDFNREEGPFNRPPL